MAMYSGGISAGTVVGISIAIFIVSFSAGALLTALITSCCHMREKGKRKRSNEQREPSSSESPQPAPVYAEVVTSTVEMKENPSYEVRLKMKNNPSYGHVGQ